MKYTNKIAVALGLKDTGLALETLQRMKDSIGLAELRLDCMEEFDLPRLIKESPCPLVITCRPTREGGRFKGSENDRLDILAQAAALGCAYVDVEWDCIDGFTTHGSSTRMIVSRHYYDTVPSDLWQQYLSMRTRADVVKLVASPNSATEALPVLRLIAHANSPVIAIAMGGAGIPTRLIAPCFASCLLTYGAADTGLGTAPGQLGIREMIDRYGIDRVSDQTRIEILLFSGSKEEDQFTGGGDGDTLRVAVHPDPSEIEEVSGAYRDLSPRISVTVIE